MDTKDYDVIWSSPSQDWHGSMPLGNGDIGLNVWVEPSGDLRFFIAKTDAWDDNARLVKVAAVRVRLTPSLASIRGPFRQTLETGSATVTVVYGPPGREVSLSVWVDANNPVVHVEIRSMTPCAATCVFEPWRTERRVLQEMEASDVLLDRSRPDNRRGPTEIEPDVVLTGLTECVGVAHHNIKSVGPGLLAEIQGLHGFPMHDPLLHRTFGALMSLESATRPDDLSLIAPAAAEHHIRIAVHTAHPVSLDTWVSQVRALLREDQTADPVARRAAHERWWTSFWDRSWIRATGAYDAHHVSRMAHLQRFVTACAGRGAYPIKFNGSLFTVPKANTTDPDYRMWGPGYWWQNTRLPYIGMPAAGDFDLMEPLVRMYTGQMLELCKHRTRRYCGHGGAFYPECIYFWGATITAAYGATPFEARVDKLQENRYHKWEWVGGLELAWMLLDLWEHQPSEELLRDAVLPVAREVITFFEEHYPRDANGRLVLHPSQAAETWWECTDPMTEVAGLTALCARLERLPPEAAPAQNRELWRRMSAMLPPIPLRQTESGPALSPARLFADKRNSENPELYAVFPFRLVALGRPNLDWGTRALEARWDRGHTGWRQDDIFMAWLGLTDQAREGVVARASVHDPAERFPAFWGPNYDWTPDQDHGGVLIKAFQSMAMQTDGEVIYLLPAWPRDWDVRFRLHAPGRTTVECVLRGGVLESVVVSPTSRAADVILPEWVRRG